MSQTLNIKQDKLNIKQDKLKITPDKLEDSVIKKPSIAQKSMKVQPTEYQKVKRVADAKLQDLTALGRQYDAQQIKQDPFVDERNVVEKALNLQPSDKPLGRISNVLLVIDRPANALRNTFYGALDGDNTPGEMFANFWEGLTGEVFTDHSDFWMKNQDPSLKKVAFDIGVTLAIGAALAAVTGGTSAAVAAVESAKKLGKLGKVAKGVKSASRVNKAVRAYQIYDNSVFHLSRGLLRAGKNGTVKLSSRLAPVLSKANPRGYAMLTRSINAINGVQSAIGSRFNFAIKNVSLTKQVDDIFNEANTNLSKAFTLEVDKVLDDIVSKKLDDSITAEWLESVGVKGGTESVEYKTLQDLINTDAQKAKEYARKLTDRGTMRTWTEIQYQNALEKSQRSLDPTKVAQKAQMTKRINKFSKDGLRIDEIRNKYVEVRELYNKASGFGTEYNIKPDYIDRKYLFQKDIKKLTKDGADSKTINAWKEFNKKVNEFKQLTEQPNIVDTFRQQGATQRLQQLDEGFSPEIIEKALQTPKPGKTAYRLIKKQAPTVTQAKSASVEGLIQDLNTKTLKTSKGVDISFESFKGEDSLDDILTIKEGDLGEFNVAFKDEVYTSATESRKLTKNEVVEFSTDVTADGAKKKLTKTQIEHNEIMDHTLEYKGDVLDDTIDLDFIVSKDITPDKLQRLFKNKFDIDVGELQTKQVSPLDNFIDNISQEVIENKPKVPRLIKKRNNALKLGKKVDDIDESIVETVFDYYKKQRDKTQKVLTDFDSAPDNIAKYNEYFDLTSQRDTLSTSRFETPDPTIIESKAGFLSSLTASGRRKITKVVRNNVGEALQVHQKEISQHLDRIEKIKGSKLSAAMQEEEVAKLLASDSLPTPELNLMIKDNFGRDMHRFVLTRDYDEFIKSSQAGWIKEFQQKGISGRDGIIEITKDPKTGGTIIDLNKKAYLELRGWQKEVSQYTIEENGITKIRKDLTDAQLERVHDLGLDVNEEALIGQLKDDQLRNIQKYTKATEADVSKFTDAEKYVYEIYGLRRQALQQRNIAISKIGEIAREYDIMNPKFEEYLTTHTKRVIDPEHYVNNVFRDELDVAARGEFGKTTKRSVDTRQFKDTDTVGLNKMLEKNVWGESPLTSSLDQLNIIRNSLISENVWKSLVSSDKKLKVSKFFGSGARDVQGGINIIGNKVKIGSDLIPYDEFKKTPLFKEYRQIDFDEIKLESIKSNLKLWDSTSTKQFLAPLEQMLDQNKRASMLVHNTMFDEVSRFFDVDSTSTMLIKSADWLGQNVIRPWKLSALLGPKLLAANVYSNKLRPWAVAGINMITPRLLDKDLKLKTIYSFMEAFKLKVFDNPKFSLEMQEIAKKNLVGDDLLKAQQKVQKKYIFEEYTKYKKTLSPKFSETDLRLAFDKFDKYQKYGFVGTSLTKSGDIGTSKTLIRELKEAKTKDPNAWKELLDRVTDHKFVKWFFGQYGQQDFVDKVILFEEIMEKPQLLKELKGKTWNKNINPASYGVKSIDEAVAISTVEVALFNFSRVSKFQKQYVQRAFMFWTWQYKMMQSMITSLMEDGGRKYALHNRFLNNIRDNVANYGEGENQQMIPKWYRESETIPLPWLDDDMNQLYINLSPVWTGTERFLPGGGILNGLHPLLKAGIQAGTGVDLFKKAPLNFEENPLGGFGKTLASPVIRKAKYGKQLLEAMITGDLQSGVDAAGMGLFKQVDTEDQSIYIERERAKKARQAIKEYLDSIGWEGTVKEYLGQVKT